MNIHPDASKIALAIVRLFGVRVRSSNVVPYCTTWGGNEGAALDLELIDGARFRIYIDRRPASEPGNGDWQRQPMA